MTTDETQDTLPIPLPVYVVNQKKPRIRQNGTGAIDYLLYNEVFTTNPVTGQFEYVQNINYCATVVIRNYTNTLMQLTYLYKYQAVASDYLEPGQSVMYHFDHDMQVDQISVSFGAVPPLVNLSTRNAVVEGNVIIQTNARHLYRAIETAVTDGWYASLFTSLDLGGSINRGTNPSGIALSGSLTEETLTLAGFRDIVFMTQPLLAASAITVTITTRLYTSSINLPAVAATATSPMQIPIVDEAVAIAVSGSGGAASGWFLSANQRVMAGFY